MASDKTVYILGAGFSYPAQVPLQSELLREILEYKASFGESEVLNAQEELKEFISTFFGSSRNISLEDIFTILDKSIIEKERFKKFLWLDMYSLKGKLIYLILFIINKKSAKVSKKTVSIYKDFSKEIIDEKLSDNKRSNNVSIISLNWDTILEERSTNIQNNIKIKHGTSVQILKSKDGTDMIKKSTGQLYKINVLKLHGSLSWLFCNNCGRLFINNQKIVDVKKYECKFCKIEKMEKKIPLEHLIITPTFLKELTNIHLKNIWQNAFIELQKASKVIFIGYSLPYADFELKYLFKKAISQNARIEVVLIKNDKTNGTKDRYTSFFGKNINFDFRGLEGWLSRKN